MSLIIAQKYSKALLEVAQEKNQLDDILNEIANLGIVIKSTDLGTFLADVTYSDEKKIKVMQELQNVSSTIVKNFLEALIVNRRLSLLPLIIQEVRNQADSLFKVSDVEVTTAVALTTAQLEKLETMIKAKFDLNEVTINNTIDKDILGGIVINARGKIIDASIKSQLTKIAKTII